MQHVQRISEVDAAPKLRRLSPGRAMLVILLLSLGLWGLIWLLWLLL
jgi:hypothetical protein